MKTTIKSLLVLALAGFVFTGCATHRCCKSQGWEYKIVKLADSDKPEAQLNKLSKEGWTLVSVVPDSYNSLGQPISVYVSSYIFKRPIH